MQAPTSWLEEREGAIRLRIRVQPRASRTEIAGEHGGELKIRVASPPVDGQANEELRRHIAKKLGVARSRVVVLAGSTSRSKVLEITGVDAEAARRALG
jgi:uncharacterized protein